MSVFNTVATKLDRKQPTSGLVTCSLLDISEFYAVGRVPPSWDSKDAVPLYTNPQEISRALRASYGSQSGLLSTSPNVQYGFSDRGPVKLSGILVDTLRKDYDATPYLDKLEGLTKPGTSTYPPVLAIVWGGRVIQPVVLTDLQIVETAWANGLVSRAAVELTFTYLPPISYRSGNDEARVSGLTDREVAKAKKLAAEDLDKQAKDTAKPGTKPTTTDPKKLTVNKMTGEVTKPGTKSDPAKQGAATVTKIYTRGQLTP